MTNLRPIKAISIADLTPTGPSTGEPIFETVDPCTLHVDGRYQRSIGERGLRQIRRIIENFDWTRFKAPTCCYAETEEGATVLFVLDGQHTAIACASHPGIKAIPVQIVEAADVETQASAFIGLNKDRLNVTPLQLHHAALAAGDEDALTVEQVCERAGIRVLHTKPAGGEYQPRDTIAVTALASLVDRRGAMRARQILEVLANAELAPIKAPDIKAAELLLTDPEYCDSIAAEDLTIAVSGSFEDEAKLFAATHKIPVWKALASVWFRNTKKRRRAA